MLRVDADTAPRTFIFFVRVQPRARKDEITGEMDGALKVRRGLRRWKSGRTRRWWNFLPAL
jgi:hypothetical protein